jgi:hypothetical protein
MYYETGAGNTATQVKIHRSETHNS